MEYPILNLGAIGFSATQRIALTTSLLAQQSQSGNAKLGAGRCVWQMTDYREANALVLNLARSEEGPDKILRFYSDPTHPNPIGVMVSELTVPFAIAHKATGRPYDKLSRDMHFLDVDSYDSVLAALQYFETQLFALRNLFAFAQLILERRGDLDIAKTYHLLRHTGLVALIDVPQQWVWLRDGSEPGEIDNCIWQTQPATHNTPGEGFTPWTMEEAFWVFAQHSRPIKLPIRYLEHPIYFRRRLRVRAALVQPRQLEILEQLSLKPLSYEDFQDIPTINLQRLKYDLYAFYMCRAITTDPRKVHSENLNSGHSSHAFGPSSQTAQGDAAPAARDTIPMGLQTGPMDLV